MTTVKLVIEERIYEFDPTRLMLSEGVALEEQWGLSVVDFQSQVFSGSPPIRAIGAMVWLVQTRALAADEGVPFAAAAARMPAADFDVNLGAIRMGAVPEPSEHPTSPASKTRTPATRTTRATSAKPKPKRDSPPAGSGTSESSPST